jgi:ABC-type nitrate/sulfonate/bicarbonate transport system substrate-binding protein
MMKPRRSGVPSALALLLAAAVLLPAGPAWAQAARKPIEVRLGWLTFAGGSSAIAAYMIRDKLFEKHAAAVGYDLKANWRSFPSGPSLNEAMAAGQLDIDMHMSALPTASRIAAGIPAVPIAVTGSHLTNAIMVAPNSPIKDVAQLPGKTVGLVLGSSSHYLLASLAWYHFGKTTEELGIKLVNMPVTEAIKMPGGIDAAAVWVPQRFIGPQTGISELLVDADGNTGKGHRTPGVRLPEVKKSWAYPEGYNTDRIYAFARDKFLAEHPDLVLAFLLGHMEAQAKVLADTEGTIELINGHWKLPRIIVETTLQTYAETAGIRRTPMLLEWDVLTIVKASEFLTFMKVRDRALAFDELKPLFLKAAEIQRRAWERNRASQPSVEDMRKGFQGTVPLYGHYIINGGAPVWEWATAPDWGKRVYVSGPFPAAR